MPKSLTQIRSNGKGEDNNFLENTDRKTVQSVDQSALLSAGISVVLLHQAIQDTALPVMELF